MAAQTHLTDTPDYFQTPITTFLDDNQLTWDSQLMTRDTTPLEALSVELTRYW